MLTGRAAKPNQARPPTRSSSVVPDELTNVARNAQTTVTAAPLAIHFSCWRRLLDERRQLSTWRPIKQTANTMSTRRLEPLAAWNQPTGLSTADSPPVASTRTGRPARAPPVATATATRCPVYTTQKARRAQRQNREDSLPSGNSRTTTINSSRP